MSKHALCIGIDKYGGTNALPGAVRSARGLAKLLIQRGFAVVELYDAAATRVALLAAVQQLWNASAAPGSVAMLHYSGHGLPIGPENCLVPVNVFPSDGSTHLAQAIPASQWKQLLARRPANTHVLTNLDCCYSAAFDAADGDIGALHPVGQSPRVPAATVDAFLRAGSPFTPLPSALSQATFAQATTTASLVEYSPCAFRQLSVELPFGTNHDYYCLWTYWLLRQMQVLGPIPTYAALYKQVRTRAKVQYPGADPVLGGDSIIAQRPFLT